MNQRRAHNDDPLDRDLRPRHRRYEPVIVSLVVLAGIALQALVPNSVASETNDVLPLVELVLLVAMISTRFVIDRIGERGARAVSLALIIVMAVGSIWTWYLVIDRLLGGRVTDGRELIIAGAKVWTTFVIIFGLLYWELDRGGPDARFAEEPALKHFQFPQDVEPTGLWEPTFFDYLYISLTNATAFSPTDTMPLTHSAKLFMGLEGVLSLGTIGLVAARAVNIL